MSSNADSALAPGARATRERAGALREEVARLEKILGRRPKLLVGELGVDGHSAAAEQLALSARDAGFDVVYESALATPEQIVTSAVEEGVHVNVVVGALPEPAERALERVGIATLRAAAEAEPGALLERLAVLAAASAGAFAREGWGGSAVR